MVEQRIDDSDKLSDEERPTAKAGYRSYAEKVFAAPVFVFIFVKVGLHPNLVGCAGSGA